MEGEISGPYPEEYKVEAMLTRVGMLTASFFIKVEPDKPIRWQILFAGKSLDGIMVGESLELNDKIVGVLLT